MVSRTPVRLMRPAGGWASGFAAALALASAQPATAAIDLSRATINRLPNGLTVMILEDHDFPVVSVQALYRSGSVDETIGKTGLAHFLEHLAFRATRNFPNAGATEAIYDAGGEWHGYTWIDQTTYFATMPRDGLDLLLRIEADRMANVTIDPASIEAERGAVLTELHSYENDPASVLLDAVMFTAFQVHGYRNNSIGLESDVEGLTLADARDFYEKHYIPANAILAIVGDVDTKAALALVERHFRGIAPRTAPVRNWSPEPAQRGERRFVLNGPVEKQYFSLVYPAPAVSNPDLPAFLVLQQLLGGGSGLNFNQNDWGTPAEGGSILDGVTGDIATWFIPTAARFLFVIKGSIDAGTDRAAIERMIDQRVGSLRSQPPTAARLEGAKTAVLGQLEADVETTEDAAHQLAYMAGVGGYDMIVHLPERVRAVTPEDVRQVAAKYLDRQASTIGWYVPGAASAPPPLGEAVPSLPPAQTGRPAKATIASPPKLANLGGALPVLVQQNPRNDTVTVQLLLSAPVQGEDAPEDLPGLGTVTRSGRPEQLANLIAEVKATAGRPLVQSPESAATPDERLEESLAAATGPSRATVTAPILAVVSGAVDPAAATKLLGMSFGERSAASLPAHAHDSPDQLHSETVRMEGAFSQGALGYVVPAAPPRTREMLAWRMMLYILSHDYSGRLGRSAIGDKGLAYHIYGAYRTDGQRGWITLTTGVDPAKADALEAEFRAQLARLVSEPPTEAEVAAARSHILGRSISAAQSNQEVADKLTRDYLRDGKTLSQEELGALLNSITAKDLAAIAADFGKGAILRVDVAPKR